MIKYNELKIDGTNLIIDLELEDTSEHNYWVDANIELVRIDTSLTYGTDTPYELITDIENNKVQLTISISGSSDEIFIVTPVVMNIAMDAPCGMDIPEVKVVYDKHKLMERGLVYIGLVGNSCAISKDFIDYILKVKAFELSVDTCNYGKAAKYWRLIHKRFIKTNTSNCGCNRIN